MQVPIYHLFPECEHCGEKHYPEVKEHCIELLKKQKSKLLMEIYNLKEVIFNYGSLTNELAEQLNEYDSGFNRR